MTSERQGPREWVIKWDRDFQYTDGVPAEIQIATGDEIGEFEKAHVIEFSAYRELERKLILAEGLISRPTCKSCGEIFKNEENHKAHIQDCLVAKLEQELADAKAELADCIKTHDENIGVLKSFQDLLKAAKNEIERLKEVCKDLNRERNSAFDQSCKNFQGIQSQSALIEKLVKALTTISKARSDDIKKAYRECATEALALHEAWEKEGK